VASGLNPIQRISDTGVLTLDQHIDVGRIEIAKALHVAPAELLKGIA